MNLVVVEEAAGAAGNQYVLAVEHLSPSSLVSLTEEIVHILSGRAASDLSAHLLKPESIEGTDDAKGSR